MLSSDGNQSTTNDDLSKTQNTLPKRLIDIFLFCFTTIEQSALNRAKLDRVLAIIDRHTLNAQYQFLLPYSALVVWKKHKERVAKDKNKEISSQDT